MPSAVFIQAIVLQTKVSLSSKFSINVGSMPKMLWECCGNTVFIPTCCCYWLSLYSYSEVFVFVLAESQLFTVSIVFCQGCGLSSLFFIVSMNWTDSNSQVNEDVTVGSCMNCLHIANNLVLLASSEKSLQHACAGFATVCDQVRMKISTEKTEVLFISKQWPSFC